MRKAIHANPWPEPNSWMGTLSRRGLSGRALQIIKEYDLTTTIPIRPLAQPCTCKMGSSIFDAIIRLKFASTTRASFPSIPSTYRTNGENISVTRGNSFCTFPPFRFTAKSEAISFYPSCFGLVPPVWLQLWPQSEFSICPILGRHLLSPNRHSPHVSIPLICCGPGGLWFCCIHNY